MLSTVSNGNNGENLTSTLTLRKLVEQARRKPTLEEEKTNKNSTMEPSKSSQAIIQFSLNDNNKTIVNYQPSISDQIKVGFYSTDRFTQTDETEILILKNATQNLELMSKEISTLQFDLKFAKNSAQNQFECELNSTAIEIYGMINCKINQLKTQQEQGLDRIRRAYKSKLANEIAKFIKMAQDQEEKFKEKLERALTKTNANLKQDESTMKIKELNLVIAEHEKSIKELKAKANENIDKINAENEKNLNELKEEKERIIQEAIKYKTKVGRLEEGLSIKEEENEKTVAELNNVQNQLQKEKYLKEQLNKEFNEFKIKAEHEKQKTRREFEKQKISLETKLNEKLKESREQILKAAKQELKQQEKLQKEQEEQLLEQQKEQERIFQEQLKQKELSFEKHKLKHESEILKLKIEKNEQEEEFHTMIAKEELQLTQALQKEKEREQEMVSSKSRQKDTELIFKLKNNELYLKAEITRLKREIQRNNETWEKKFDILKHNLHAIKDEMYLRQNLQKQSSQFSLASVAYTMQEPPNLYHQLPQIVESNKSGSAQTDIKAANKQSNLPPINENNKSDTRPISFTISVPSRSSDTNLETDEAQIIGDDEILQLKEEYFNEINFISTKKDN